MNDKHIGEVSERTSWNMWPMLNHHRPVSHNIRGDHEKKILVNSVLILANNSNITMLCFKKTDPEAFYHNFAKITYNINKNCYTQPAYYVINYNIIRHLYT